MAEPLKNSFNKAMVERLAHSLARAHPTFEVKRFVTSATRDFEQLELLELLKDDESEYVRRSVANRPTGTKPRQT